MARRRQSEIFEGLSEISSDDSDYNFELPKKPGHKIGKEFASQRLFHKLSPGLPRIRTSNILRLFKNEQRTSAICMSTPEQLLNHHQKSSLASVKRDKTIKNSSVCDVINHLENLSRSKKSFKTRRSSNSFGQQSNSKKDLRRTVIERQTQTTDSLKKFRKRPNLKDLQKIDEPFHDINGQDSYETTSETTSGNQVDNETSKDDAIDDLMKQLDVEFEKSVTIISILSSSDASITPNANMQTSKRVIETDGRTTGISTQPSREQEKELVNNEAQVTITNGQNAPDIILHREVSPFLATPSITTRNNNKKGQDSLYKGLSKNSEIVSNLRGTSMERNSSTDAIQVCYDTTSASETTSTRSLQKRYRNPPLLYVQATILSNAKQVQKLRNKNNRTKQEKKIQDSTQKTKNSRSANKKEPKKTKKAAQKEKRQKSIAVNNSQQLSNDLHMSSANKENVTTLEKADKKRKRQKGKVASEQMPGKSTKRAQKTQNKNKKVKSPESFKNNDGSVINNDTAIVSNLQISQLNGLPEHGQSSDTALGLRHNDNVGDMITSTINFANDEINNINDVHNMQLEPAEELPMVELPPQIVVTEGEENVSGLSTHDLIPVRENGTNYVSNNDILYITIDNEVVPLEWASTGLQPGKNINNNEETDVSLQYLQKNMVTHHGMISNGIINIEPGKCKQPQITKMHTLIFYVIKGDASVRAQGKIKLISTGSIFCIPLGAEYSITNRSNTNPVVLLFLKLSNK